MIDRIDSSSSELRQKCLKAAEELRASTESAHDLLDRLLDVQARMAAMRDDIAHPCARRARGGLNVPSEPVPLRETSDAIPRSETSEPVRLPETTEPNA